MCNKTSYSIKAISLQKYKTNKIIEPADRSATYRKLNVHIIFYATSSLRQQAQERSFFICGDKWSGNSIPVFVS